MSKIIDNAYRSNSVVFDVNYAAGSIADKSPYKAAATVTTPVQWVNTKKGYAISNNTTGVLAYNNNAYNRLAGSNATFIILGSFDKQVATARFISKRDGVKIDYEIYTNSATQITFYDWTNLSVMTASIIGKSLLVVTLNSGQKPKLYLDGVYATEGSLTNTIRNNVTPPKLYVSNFYTGAFPNKNILNRVTILNTVLSAQEISQLYTELTSERFPLRAYSFGSRISAPKDPPGVTALLKTDFTTKLPDGRLADLSGNGWHGTIKPGFVAAKGMFGNSLVANSATRSYIDFGDVTPINGASKLTVLWYGKRGTSNAAECIYSKATAANARIGAYFTTTTMYTGIGNGENFGASDANVNTTLFRADVYDGSAVLESRGQIYADGNKLVTTATAGCPATLPNSAAINLEVGRLGFSVNNQPCQQNDFFAIYTSALTPDQVSYIYRQIASRCTFSLDLNRTPISLVNVVGIGTEIPSTPFKLGSLGGTWKVSEDSSGKHWMESVATDSTAVYMRSTQAYGTWVGEVTHTAAGEYFWFISNKTDIANAARTAYALYLTGTTLSLIQYKPSSQSTTLWAKTTAITVGKAYKFAVTRTSQGVFTVYVKGGEYGAIWTLVAATSGTNPVTNSDYTTSSYLLCAVDTAASGGKFGRIDMFQGALSIDQLA